MNFYNSSSQKTNWIKTPEQLEEISKQKVKKILDRINNINAKISSILDGKKKNTVSGENSNQTENTNNNYRYIKANKLLELEKENLLIIYFANKMLHLINSNIKSKGLKTYSLTFFRRFFLKKSIVDYDIDFMLCSSIFLGGKVAQLDLNIEKMKELFSFLNGIDQSTNKRNIDYLFSYEFYLCHILNYDFYVFSPYKALTGFIYQLNKKNFFNDINNFNLQNFEIECEGIIDKTFLTDLLFLYSYSKLALCAVIFIGQKYQFNNENIFISLEIKDNLNYNTFINECYNDFVDKINKIVIISEDDYRNYLTKVAYFNKHYSSYGEKLKEERAKLLDKMKNFDNIFSQNVEPENKNDNLYNFNEQNNNHNNHNNAQNNKNNNNNNNNSNNNNYSQNNENNNIHTNNFVHDPYKNQYINHKRNRDEEQEENINDNNKNNNSNNSHMDIV